jgi:excisionase family DNA binding protein
MTRTTKIPEDDLITTGEAAALLGTTARHVVNLTVRGELPYTITGTHRRIRRADVLALAARPAAANGDR